MGYVSYVILTLNRLTAYRLSGIMPRVWKLRYLRKFGGGFGNKGPPFRGRQDAPSYATFS